MRARIVANITNIAGHGTSTATRRLSNHRGSGYRVIGTSELHSRCFADITNFRGRGPWRDSQPRIWGAGTRRVCIQFKLRPSADRVIWGSEIRPRSLANISPTLTPRLLLKRIKEHRRPPFP